jgi:hypothetical protein
MPKKLSLLEHVHLLEVIVLEMFLILKKILWTPNYQDCIYTLPEANLYMKGQPYRCISMIITITHIS